ncbi:uncharacterized protein LOC109595585 isoform X3 [Aethina tumida]|uniref:uncharacterized protein LOC109595585 isoform X3 n=1 Tax=Aethina tumida TaxID=116153 RepID=UPI0021484E84|nr:uncharacterized protein LOC109595585 isoform X3 [Aethina tumida]
MEDVLISSAVVIIILFFLGFLLRWCVKSTDTNNESVSSRIRNRNSQRQQNEVFSISGRVQGQNPTQTLSSDAFVSIGHITASNQFNKPPTNDEPPSYEEAICLPVPDLRQTRIQVQQPPSHTVAMN